MHAQSDDSKWLFEFTYNESKVKFITKAVLLCMVSPVYFFKVLKNCNVFAYSIVPNKCISALTPIK